MTGVYLKTYRSGSSGRCWSPVYSLPRAPARRWRHLLPCLHAMRAALALLMTIQGVLTEYCPSYNDSYGRYKKGFYCPKLHHLWRLNYNYCCGNDTYHTCCNDINISIFNHTETAIDAYWQEYWPYFAFIGIAVLVLMLSPFLAPHRRSVVSK